LRRLADRYRNLATLALSVAVAGVLGNLVAWPLLALLETDPVTARYGAGLVASAYPQRSPAEVEALLAETWSDPMVYRPFVQAGERPRAGRFVNVDPAGFRHSASQQAWPPARARFNVFVLGGSTAFGHGVADDETFASALQEALRGRTGEREVAVYNFAAAGYYSSHERVLFGELLAAGARPDLLVQLDGLNDFFFDEPQFTNRLERLASERPAVLGARLVRQLPAVALALELGHRLRARRDRRAAQGKPPFDPVYDDRPLLEARIARYLANVRAVDATARAAGVHALFVVQPVPTHGFDLAGHPFAAWGFDRHAYSHFGYPLLRERLEREPPEAMVLWAAELLRERTAPSFVDQVHYAPELARDLAAWVAERIPPEWLDRGL
jgi:hypothetical protein